MTCYFKLTQQKKQRKHCGLDLLKTKCLFRCIFQVNCGLYVLTYASLLYGRWTTRKYCVILVSDVTAPVKVDIKLIVIACLSLCISTRLAFPWQCNSTLQ